jgi:signal transduction histidine kinase
MARADFNSTGLSLFRRGFEFQYSPKRRAEFLIAVGRLVLATFSLLAVWIDPSVPVRDAQIAYALFAGYVAYSLLLLVFVLRGHLPQRNLPVVTHGFDLFLFAIFMFFTEGPTSPFFVYFVFSLFCAILRWGWRGVIWTALIAMMTFMAMGIYAGKIMQDPAFELDRFIIRSVYLGVIAALLVYLGIYEERRRGELSGLAAWPRAIHNELRDLLSDMLRYVAGILRAPRMIMTWEEEEEPWLHVASWSSDDFRYTREPPDAFEPLVPEPLQGADFLCADIRVAVPLVLHSSPGGLQRWHGTPLNLAFQERFDIRGSLSLNMEGKGLNGRLFVLDKKRMTSDDLVLGRIVANELATQMDYFNMMKQLQRSAVVEERVRMARDLHDGLLQSLTGTALQLETVNRLMEADSPKARQQLMEIQRLIAAEQKELRSYVEEMKASLLSQARTDSDLATRLRELAERVERHWGIHVEMIVKHLPADIPRPLVQEIYFLVHESLTNAARHAKASSVCAEVGVDDDHVNITVTDNGHGFPFRGRYDHAMLTTQKRGPITLRERTTSLGGRLTIDSTDTGALLEITIPLSPAGG